MTQPVLNQNTVETLSHKSLVVHQTHQHFFFQPYTLELMAFVCSTGVGGLGIKMHRSTLISSSGSLSLHLDWSVFKILQETEEKERRVKDVNKENLKHLLGMALQTFHNFMMHKILQSVFNFDPIQDFLMKL